MFLNRKIRKDLSHPNSLTLYRIVVIPAIVILLLSPNKYTTFISAIIFSLAAITDYLDGFYARRRGLVSDFGKIMDPIADKLLVSSAFIMLTSHGWIQGWIACVIIGREIAITGLRNIVVEKGGDVASSPLGKYKTGFQVGAIIPLLIHYPLWGINVHAVGSILLWAALVFTVWSGIDYFFRFRRHLYH
ncbi:MAG: CDP-diacylglycerol--glycerol-3-phosphate 3-phosphatidyltransferase [Deltaproteobacteria bacterium]|nr:CDP-diacylglycerol--glycerol-3-phosphate 3-phosphatidyltransferase [Deltaproteobacteria bacterium]MBW1960967.1 CDP-diacylglycerol--glycerol-3-phosphate 3-phosphatidyltransferase [Deltaproteobacteria bacterium]MBW1995484.1 CDP-diacylglycerol--glycerol-3-phosphate 3-phosphatidyltransferase [Deltaproteobacteria bacterium]MBW2151530.1 CDP-diacylglycerol--glycerol-3-phosphate 3-phosphatidyltransferase [Deltaproteobacteria bacterium]